MHSRTGKPSEPFRRFRFEPALVKRQFPEPAQGTGSNRCFQAEPVLDGSDIVSYRGTTTAAATITATAPAPGTATAPGKATASNPPGILRDLPGALHETLCTLKNPPGTQRHKARESVHEDTETSARRSLLLPHP